MSSQNNLDYIADLQLLIKGTVLKDKVWYRTSSKVNYYAYRISGILIILLSSSLPLLTANTFMHKDLIISIVGILIAVISSLISFFKWNDIWKADSFAFVELKNALAIWEFKMLNAKSENTESKKIEMSKKATIELFTFLQSIDTKNNAEYFKHLNELASHK
jgi:hypothetical protein